MARRGENIYKRKDGRWEGRYIKYRDPQTGKAKYGSVYHSTYSGVKEALQKAKTLTPQSPFTPQKYTLEQWMTAWLEETVQPHVKPSSYANYYRLAHNHIYPSLGKMKLQDISILQIQDFIKNKLISGRLDGTGALSIKTVKILVQILRMCLNYAVQQEVISANPAINTKLPKTLPASTRVFSLQEQKKLEEAIAATSTSIFIGVLVCLYTGLRIGELCALQWKDIDLDAATISVNKTIQRMQVFNTSAEKVFQKTKIMIGPPKSQSSIRIIPISTGLKEHLLNYYDQLEYYNRKPESYFIQNQGKLIEPRLYQKYFAQLLRQANIPNANFHTLRHTFATRCIELHVDMKSLSQILGHSTVSITLNTYVHSFIEQQRQNMNKLDCLMLEHPQTFLSNPTSV